MFQFLRLAVAGLYLNLFYVLEVIDHGSILQIRFSDNREPLTITGDDVATVRTALQPAMLMELEAIQCRCCAEDSPPDLHEPDSPPTVPTYPETAEEDAAAPAIPAVVPTDHARDQASVTD